jgi:nanoRNase/pAp phosphatase (c-di-AMP/oligoRNAs hydrolase)
LPSFDDINNAKHIVISLPEQAGTDAVASANALYSYLLTLHKKVSFFSKKESFGKNLDFLPWMDKLKCSYPSSADLDIKLENSDEVFVFFKNNSIKLNSKMATSLYASLLAKSEGFSKTVSADDFILAESLLKFGADVDSCNRYILNYNSLASLRLKAILLGKMLLKDQGKTAYFELEEIDLKSSGADMSDVRNVLKDALSLPTVNSVIVQYKNEEIIREGK